MEYRKGPNELYHAFIQIESAAGERFGGYRALVDTGSTKCTIPRKDNELLFHLKKAGTDLAVDTALGPASFDWVTVPKMILMKEVDVKLGNIRFASKLEETDLRTENTKAWLGDEYMVGANFIDEFRVTMTRGNSIVFEKP